MLFLTEQLYAFLPSKIREKHNETLSALAARPNILRADLTYAFAALKPAHIHAASFA